MDIKATWMRGGTSKCWVIESEDLDATQISPDQLLPRLFGSPDHRQIDGVGGGTSTTSKAMIIRRPIDDLVDVEFTFAQVGIEEAVVDWGSNCGNCSAAVGLYALEHGWVTPTGNMTEVVTRNTNTDQIIVQRIPTPTGQLPADPLATIPGVPFPGHRVGLGFRNPVGKTTGHLLPTGAAKETLSTEHGSWTVSLVDAGAPLVILNGRDFALEPDRFGSWAQDIEPHLQQLDRLRRRAAVRMGLAPTESSAARAIPKIALISAPSTVEDDVDVQVMMLSMGKPHPALAVTGSVALTVAALTAGTVINDVLPGGDRQRLRLRTPAGLLETWTDTESGTLVVGVDRTARTIASSTLYFPESLGLLTEVSLAGATR
ncbi:PrpF domain-containing protein [Glutamicibacter sp. NPDC087344]|uniref:PrpF domain-containing protein n=1 Tax=Glutamicibacter sp. NPDC087344 TaxID=3363994 RepID=UPI0037FBF73E